MVLQTACTGTRSVLVCGPGGKITKAASKGPVSDISKKKSLALLSDNVSVQETVPRRHGLERL